MVSFAPIRSQYTKIHNVTGKVIRVTLNECGDIIDETPVFKEPSANISPRTKKWLAATRAEPTDFWYRLGKSLLNLYCNVRDSIVIARC